MKKQEMAPQGADAAVAKPDFSLIDENLLKSRIYTIRGVKVMLDADLAEIYGYETKAFNRQVKNNIERFPEEFRFLLTKTDMENCPRCKICTLDRPSQNIFVDFKAKGEKLYHCGASSKDAGNKITTIVQLDDIEGYRPMFEELWAQKTPL